MCCLISRSRIFLSYGDVNIAGDGLQNLGLCSVLLDFYPEGSLSCQTFLDEELGFCGLIRRTALFNCLVESAMVQRTLSISDQVRTDETEIDTILL